MAAAPTPRKSANGSGSIFTVTTANGVTKWKVQVTLGRDSKGRLRRTTRTVNTKRQAEVMLRQMLAQQDKGLLAQSRTDTVTSFGVHWAREERPQRVRPATAAEYEDVLRRYVNPTLGNVRIVELTAAHVEKMMNVLRSDGKGSSTINKARRVLFGMCTYAVRLGLIPHNPVSAVETVRRQPGDKTQVRQPWTLEETKSALTATRDDDALDCFMHVMLYTGLRPGEALGIRWCDIDFDQRLLHVTGTLREERRLTPEGIGVVRLVRNDPKTVHSRRTLTIEPNLMNALERQQMRNDLWRTIAGPDWVDSGYVHTTRLGTPFNISNVRKYFYRCLDRAELRRIRLHDIRHVVARLGLEADLRIEDVSQALGHTRIDTTKQIYAGHVQKLNDRFTTSISDLLATTQSSVPDSTERHAE